MVQARIAHAYPAATVHRHLWASAFRLGQGQTRSYRAGRWALAGDAAHAMGPSAGAGMMVGLLGAWRLATAIATSARRGSDGWDGAVARYEDGQREASGAVQRTNALISRNLAGQLPAPRRHPQHRAHAPRPRPRGPPPPGRTRSDDRPCTMTSHPATTRGPAAEHVGHRGPAVLNGVLVGAGTPGHSRSSFWLACTA